MTMYELYGRASRQRNNLAVPIVNILKEYGKSLPIDFLASILGRKKVEILVEIEALENLGVVTREADTVKLR